MTNVEPFTKSQSSSIVQDLALHFDHHKADPVLVKVPT